MLWYIPFCVLDYIGKKFIVGGRMDGFQGASPSMAIKRSHTEFPVNAGVHSTDMQQIKNAHL